MDLCNQSSSIIICPFIFFSFQFMYSTECSYCSGVVKDVIAILEERERKKDILTSTNGCLLCD